ncbi:MAG: polyprenyl synthetase family protein [candidate division KSB1 bacterium]|nr:polyprenyl synthetase family protein [candidate division KSB1 bacterium]
MKDFKDTVEFIKTAIQAQIFERLQSEQGTLLYSPVHYALDTGGKRLRPVLLYLTYQLLSDPDQSVLDAAAAVEILHNFTLVHDDIMDRDELRRGKETVYKRWDENVAILAGDAMLVKCYEALSFVSSKLLPGLMFDFSRAILAICEGQMMDMSFETRDDVTLLEYFDMIDKKTARLFALACESGVYLAGASSEQKNAMHQYGMAIGRAFQIQDDLLDVSAEESVLGKDVGSDMINGKKTFLVLHMNENMNSEQRRQMTPALDALNSDPNSIRKVYDILRDIGTIKAAQSEIQTALVDAKQALYHFPLNSARQSLEDLVKLIEHRTF